MVGKYAVAPTATNFRSQATDMKQKGVEVVITVAEINAISNLARAFADVGYQPKAPFYGAQTYSQKFIKLAGAAAEGTIAGMIFHVPEEAASSRRWPTSRSGTSAPRPAPTSTSSPSSAGSPARSSRDAIRNAGPDPTQAKVVAELQKFTNYESEYVVAASTSPGRSRRPASSSSRSRAASGRRSIPSGAGFACV